MIIFFSMGMYYLIKTRRPEAYFIVIPSLVLLLKSVIQTLFLASWILDSPDTGWTNIVFVVTLIEWVFWILLGVGMILLVLRILKLEKERRESI